MRPSILRPLLNKWNYACKNPWKGNLFGNRTCILVVIELQYIYRSINVALPPVAVYADIAVNANQ